MLVCGVWCAPSTFVSLVDRERHCLTSFSRMLPELYKFTDHPEYSWLVPESLWNLHTPAPRKYDESKALRAQNVELRGQRDRLADDVDGGDADWEGKRLRPPVV